MGLAVPGAPGGDPGLVVVAGEIGVIPEVLDRLLAAVLCVVLAKGVLSPPRLIVRCEDLRKQ